MNFPPAIIRQSTSLKCCDEKFMLPLQTYLLTYTHWNANLTSVFINALEGFLGNFFHIHPTYFFYFILIASDSVAHTFHKPILYRHAHTHILICAHVPTKKAFYVIIILKIAFMLHIFFPLPYHIHRTLDCCFFWIASCNENCLVSTRWEWKEIHWKFRSRLLKFFLFYFNFLVH